MCHIKQQSHYILSEREIHQNDREIVSEQEINENEILATGESLRPLTICHKRLKLCYVK